MNGKNKYLEVGIFVTAGIGLLLMLSLMFAGGRTNESTKDYSLLFQRDISGLSVGAPVRYLGVEVGQVTDMQLNTTNGTSVQVNLELLESTPVNTSTFASLSFQGVTGVAFVSLAEDKEIPANALAPQDGFKYPIIPTRDIGLSALLSSGPEITNRLVEFLDNANLVFDKANLVLDDKNLMALSNSLSNIESLTATLAAQESTIAELPTQLKGILSDIEKTTTQLQGTIAKGEPDLLAAMKNLDEATESFKKVTTRLDDWTLKHEANIDAFMSGGLAQTPELLDDTRVAVRELEKLLADFRKNPSQLIYKPQSAPVIVEN